MTICLCFPYLQLGALGLVVASGNLLSGLLEWSFGTSLGGGCAHLYAVFSYVTSLQMVPELQR